MNLLIFFFDLLNASHVTISFNVNKVIFCFCESLFQDFIRHALQAKEELENLERQWRIFKNSSSSMLQANENLK